MSEPAETKAHAEKGLPYPVTIGMVGLIGLIYLYSAWPTLETPQVEILNQWAFDPKAVDAGEYWRILTGNLVHANLSHLGNNAFGLLVFGISLERMMGSGRLIFLTLFSALCTSLFSYLFLADPSVGASGIVYGYMGAYILLTLIADRLFNPQHFATQLRSALILCLIFIYWNWSQSADVNIWGHLGGGVAGILYGLWAGWQLTRLYKQLQRKRQELAENP